MYIGVRHHFDPEAIRIARNVRLELPADGRFGKVRVTHANSKCARACTQVLPQEQLSLENTLKMT